MNYGKVINLERKVEYSEEDSHADSTRGISRTVHVHVHFSILSLF